MDVRRRGNDIEGVMRITRGPQEHLISGTWKGDDIRFWRALSQSSGQPFEGTVRNAGGEVRMTGRFAHQLQGVWSADCKPQTEMERPPLPAPGGARYRVILTGYEDQKIAVIKAVRSVTRLGLKDAKNAVESTPYTVKAGVSADEAQRIAAQIQEAGGSVQIEPQP